MIRTTWLYVVGLAFIGSAGCAPQGGGGGDGNSNSSGNSTGNSNTSSNDDSPGSGDSDLVITAVTPDGANDLLYLSGSFGDEEGVVSVGGVTLSIVSWAPAAPQPQQIVCNLPRGVHGDVVVQVGTRFSNVAQLSQWEFSLTSTTVINATAPSTGQIIITINVDLIILACINELLPAGEDGFTAAAAISRDSTAMIETEGSISNPAPPGGSSSTITPVDVDPQEFLVVYPGDTVDPETDLFTLGDFVAYANRDDDGESGFKLLFSVNGYYTEITRIGSLVSPGEEFTGFATNTFFDTSLPIQFPWDGFDIAAGQVSAISDPNTVLQWQGAPANSPPVEE